MRKLDIAVVVLLVGVPFLALVASLSLAAAYFTEPTLFEKDTPQAAVERFLHALASGETGAALEQVAGDAEYDLAALGRFGWTGNDLLGEPCGDYFDIVDVRQTESSAEVDFEMLFVPCTDEEAVDRGHTVQTLRAVLETEADGGATGPQRWAVDLGWQRYLGRADEAVTGGGRYLGMVSLSDLKATWIGDGVSQVQLVARNEGTRTLTGVRVDVGCSETKTAPVGTIFAVDPLAPELMSIFANDMALPLPGASDRAIAGTLAGLPAECADNLFMEVTGLELLPLEDEVERVTRAFEGGHCGEPVDSSPALLLPDASTVLLGKRCSIGRGGSNDIQVPDPTVSRRHIEIQRTADGTFELRDLGSKNGTWVGDTQLAPETPQPLQPGDVIFVGSVRMVFGYRETVER